LVVFGAQEDTAHVKDKCPDCHVFRILVFLD